MNIVILLFDHITALDAIGPYEVLQRLPGAEVTFVGPTEGLVRTDTRVLGLHADAAIERAPKPDLLLIPGGYGADLLCRDQRVLDWVREAHAHATWTTSVCTGSLILGAADLLVGLEATTHWMRLEDLAGYGAKPVSQRVVFQGKVVTAAGVSSGIDMGLALAAKIAGDDIARAIQLGIEYDPEPPFDCGAPHKAPAPIVDYVRKLVAARREQGAPWAVKDTLSSAR